MLKIAFNGGLNKKLASNGELLRGSLKTTPHPIYIYKINGLVIKLIRL